MMIMAMVLIITILVMVPYTSVNKDPDYKAWNNTKRLPRITSMMANPAIGGKKTYRKILQWRHNGRDGVPNHQHHDCLLNRLSMHRSKKTSKLRVTGLCVGNSPVTGEFPAQMVSNAENVSIWWRHHVYTKRYESSKWWEHIIICWELLFHLQISSFTRWFTNYAKPVCRRPTAWNARISL